MSEHEAEKNQRVRNEIIDGRKQSFANSKSPQLKKQIYAATLVCGVVLGGILFVSWNINGKDQSGSKPLATAVMVPDEEITETDLDSMLQGPEAYKRPKASKSLQTKSMAPINLPPVGSMTIYMADNELPVGSLGVPMGTELKAIIEKTVIASDNSAPVIARLSQHYIKDGQLLLPKNSKLFGKTIGAVANRLNVKFSRIVFPSGEEHPFSAMALDRRGINGIPGKRNRKTGRRGLSVLGGAALGATSVLLPRGADYRDTFMRGAHQGSMSEAGRDLNHYRRTGASPIITIKANTRFNIFVDRQS